MFEQQNDDEDGSSESSEASDVEEVDEVEFGSTTSVSDDLESNLTDNASEDSDDPKEPDEELRSFDAKLAQALGTRPRHQDADGESISSTDEDMNDDQMEALDEHLAKVFREQKKLTKKKSEKKDAKETIVNFKCRVLELLEIYVKKNHSRTRSMHLLTPLLVAIRTTTSSLVSTKACSLIREYAKLCKGDGLPKLEDAAALFKHLEEVHLEAGREASNAHSSACSQASLIIVKALVAHDRENLRQVVKMYGNTQEQVLFDPHYKVKTLFFTDWLNWCTSAQKIH